MSGYGAPDYKPDTVEHVYAFILGVDTLASNAFLLRRTVRQVGWLTAGIPTALVLLPPIARADGVGATIHILPDSFLLEGRVEVEHQCGGNGVFSIERECTWYGEASQYPANVECPGIFDATHGVWIGSLERGTSASNGTFSFAPEATEVHLCLYVDAQEDNLVGESHPFNTQTGREALPHPPPEPSRDPTTTTVQLKIHGCKITTNWLINGNNYAVGGNITWAFYRQSKHNTFKRVAGQTSPEKALFVIKAPPGTYRFSARFLGDSNLLPSSKTAAVVFRIKRCTK